MAFVCVRAPHGFFFFIILFILCIFCNPFYFPGLGFFSPQRERIESPPQTQTLSRRAVIAVYCYQHRIVRYSTRWIIGGPKLFVISNPVDDWIDCPFTNGVAFHLDEMIKPEIMKSNNNIVVVVPRWPVQSSIWIHSRCLLISYQIN